LLSLASLSFLSSILLFLFLYFCLLFTRPLFFPYSPPIPFSHCPYFLPTSSLTE
jgi:hypothetical protein